MTVGELLIYSRQVVEVLFFFLPLCLSVTVVHMFFKATRAMSKVMVKFRRYHSLNVKREEKKRVRGCLLKLILNKIN